MAEVESSPIVILSEDENEDDDDDIVVLGEEKMTITADDDDDDDNDEVIFIAASQPASNVTAKVKDENTSVIKSDLPTSKDLPRSLSLTSAFDLSLTLTAPLDLSKHTERSDIQNSTTKLDKETTLVDLEEADSQQSLADDLLNSVAGSSLSTTLVSPVSPPTVDSDSSSDTAMSPQVTSNWPVKWSPQPSTSGVKSTPTSSSCSSRSSSASAIDDFLELFKSYDQSPQTADNQSTHLSVSNVGAGQLTLQACDNTKSSSPISLSADTNGSTISSAYKPVQSPIPRCSSRDNTNSTADTSMTFSAPATAVSKSKAIDDSLYKSSLSKVANSRIPSASVQQVQCNSLLGPTGCASGSNQVANTNSSFQSGSGTSFSSETYSKNSCGSQTVLGSNSGSGIITCGSVTNSGSDSSGTSSSFQTSPGTNNGSDISSGSSSSFQTTPVTNSGSDTSSGSSNQQSGTSSYKLSQYSLPIRKRVRHAVKSEDGLRSKSEDACVNCKFILQDLKVSRCTQGHLACGSCLEDQVKLILTDKQGSLKCIMENCGSYYPMSELKHTLPVMVVDILEDKLHKDYINFVADMMLKDTGDTDQAGSSSSKADKGDDSSPKKPKLDDDDDILQQFEPLKEIHSDEKDAKAKSIVEGHPPNWEAMEDMKFLIMVLEPDSEEYVDVAIKFHSTLSFPSADIVKISRVQNPILWRYYQLKRTEMIHDYEGVAVEERQLFHGTSSSVIEAIVRKGFDWRVCGKHGSVYGQGSYFAKAASYSHQYTERQSGPGNHNGIRSRMMALRSTISALRSNNPPVFRQAQNRILLGPFNQMQVSQILPNHLLPPPPAHMPISSSILPTMHQQTHSSAGSQASQKRNLTANLTIIASNFSEASTSSLNTNQSPSSNSIPNGIPNAGSAVNLFPSNSSPSFPPSFNPAGSGCGMFPVPSNNNTTQFSPNLPGQSAPTQKTSKDPKSRIVSVSDIVASSSRKMFLAKVLVGKYTGGNTSYRRPPPLYPTEPYGKCYDSCVDNIWDPKIFVIFDTNQAYPEYIVEYNVSSE